MILQDSINSLNPYEKIKKQLLETYIFHSKEKVTNDYALEEIKQLLLDVGFEDIDRILNSYPNELSGGMRQRIAIVLFELRNDPSGSETRIFLNQRDCSDLLHLPVIDGREIGRASCRERV